MPRAEAQTDTPRLPGGWQLVRLRSLGRGTLLGVAAGIIAGVATGGVGSRIAMRIAAVLGGEKIAGLVTENGNVVGDITVDGTVGLIIFGGVFPGIVGGWLYVLIRRWLPGQGWWHGPLFGTLLLMTFGAVIINVDNADFRILGPSVVNVTMFALLFVVFGLLVAPVAGVLDRTLPPAGQATGGWSSRCYIAVLAIPVAFSFAAIGVGLPALLLLLIATYVWWPELPPRAGFLRSRKFQKAQRIAPYVVIPVGAIVGAFFLASNVAKII